MKEQQFIDIVLIGKLGFTQDSKQPWIVNKDDSFINTSAVVTESKTFITIKFHHLFYGKDSYLKLPLKGNLETNIERFVERFNRDWPSLKAYNVDFLKRQNNKSDYSKWFESLPSNVIEDASYCSRELATTSHKILFNEAWTNELKEICRLFNKLGFKVDVNRETKSVSFNHLPTFIEKFYKDAHLYEPRFKDASLKLTSDEKSAASIRDKYTTVIEKFEAIQKLILDVELRLFVF